MDRRRFLAGASVTTFLAAVNAPMSLAQGPYRTTKFIDVHCHIFNADDLPVVGFIEKVVLPSREEFKKYETRYGNVVRFLVRYLARWLKDSAPSAESEIKLLNDVKAGKKQARSPAEVRTADIENIAALVGQLKRLRIDGKNFSLGEGIISAYLPGVVVGMMHREAFPERFTDTGLGNIDHAYDPDYWVTSNQEIAERLYHRGDGPISQYLKWGVHFTRYRHELADQLAAMHGSRARLLTPALIDYTHWLNDRSDVRLGKQVDVMGQIARRPGRQVPVHGFAPFDPLREAVHRKLKSTTESPLDLAKRAVRSEGFMGVKLYPPMGFMPFDNAKHLFAGNYPQHLRTMFGGTLNKDLDAALGDLYAWCAAEQVPILAHAADSNGAGENYSKRAAPENWRAVTRQFPGIRIALAHFGDFEAGFDRPGNRNPKLSGTWEWRMGKLVRESQSTPVFIDLSYLSAVLLDENHNRRKEVIRMLQGVRAEFREISGRLVFGTDWIMFGKEEALAKYDKNGAFADRVCEFLQSAGFGAPDIDGIMYGNAANFLGLTLPTDVTGSRRRLTKFYNANHLDAGWLADFPTQSS